MKKLLYLAAVPVALTSCCQEKVDTPPNIVVFLADDLGYGDLSSYGNKIIQTPALDKFASEGVVLTDCHSAGTVSSPSRAGLMTGRNPYRLSFFYIHGKKNYLNSDEVTMAELMKEGGYETGFWGKWHLSTLEQSAYQHPGPSEQGFDYWMATTLNAFEGPKNPKKFIKNGEPMGEVDGWYCDTIVDDVIGWLKGGRDKQKPFFIYLCSHEPHTPINPPQQYSEMYQNSEVDSLEKEVKYGQLARPDYDITPNKDEFYGTVTQLDAAFGRLMNTLDSLGLSENTLVLFTSDNGPEAPVTDEESLGEWDDPIRDYCFGTPGDLRGMKRFPYEGGHRVPGIVRYPKAIAAGTRSDVLFSGCDILPTLCATAGISTNKSKKLDGINAFNAFLNKKVDERESTIWLYPNHEDTFFRMPQACLRRDNYTLIGWLPKKAESMTLEDWVAQYDPETFELYDIVKDPEQQNNIAAENADIVNSMKVEMIASWREMCNEGIETVKRN